MEKTEKQNEPASAPEAQEAQKIWQEYLQKCCEVGQLDHALSQLESQRKDIEKNFEVTQRAVKSLAAKHKEHQQKLASKIQLPKAEETVEAH